MTTLKRAVPKPDDSKVLFICGSKGTGKTTFVTSGSKFITRKYSREEPIHCDDVVILQGDTNGTLGPAALGLIPQVIDLSAITDLETWLTAVKKVLPELRKGFESKDFRILGVDLGQVDRLLRAKVGSSTQGWVEAGNKAKDVYDLLRSLPNAILAGMSHLQVPLELAASSTTSDRRDAVSVGGQKATLVSSLFQGHRNAWVPNADHVIVTLRKRPTTGNATLPTYSVLLQNTAKYEAGGRWESYFQPEEPANLRAMLTKVYGEVV